MKARNFLTLLGAICSAFGKPMMIQAPTPTLFWIGMVLDSGGTALLGVRAIMHGDDTPKAKPQRPGGLRSFGILLVLLGLLLLPLFLMAGCTTIEREDGSRETRFDGAAVAEVLKTGVDTYEQVDRLRKRYPDRPVYPPGAPFPIYPPTQP